jgi:cytochrome P450
MTITTALPTLDYEGLHDPAEAQRRIAAARRQGPVAMGAHGPEVLGYDLVRIALRDSRFATPRGLGLAAQGLTSGPLWDRVVNGLLSLDGDAHQRQRRLVAKAFTSKAAARLTTTISAVVTELVDRSAANGHCDVVGDIARQYPIPIICALIGAPREDWQLFSDWADDIFKVFNWNVAEDEPVIMRAWLQLEDYIDDMVEQRRRHLTDDLLSDLIRAEEDGDRLTGEELRLLVAGLFAAGTDTTRNQLAASVQVLCEHPDQWALLGAHPELAPRVVEETMRHAPVVFAALRAAKEDVELGGVVIPADTLIVVNTAAANRDPVAFENPDAFDVTRASGPAMLTFGGGIHYCLGVHLARLELAEALAAMTLRMPKPRIIGEVPWKPITGVTGPTRLAIEFDRES